MYAVIDIGSNTVRLVLYRLVSGEFRQVLSSKESAGLAGYVEKDGRMNERGIQKAIRVLQHFQQLLSEIHPDKIFAFATASLRNISNTEEVLAAITAVCPLDIQVLSGEKEALLDYYGALRTITRPEGLMVDIGGGSTELVYFRDRQAERASSLPMGSLNLYNRFVHDVLPTEKELDAISAYAQEQIRQLSFPLPDGQRPELLCGVGGTCRASCKLSDELYHESAGYTGYPCKRIGKMLRLFHSDRRRLLSAMIKSAPDRLHTLLPGLAILDAVSDYFGCTSFSASPYGVREGYLLYRLEDRHEP